MNNQPSYKGYTRAVIIITLAFIILAALMIGFVWLFTRGVSPVNVAYTNTNLTQKNINMSDNKFCAQDSDCGLLECSGCFSQEFLKTAPPDLACMKFQGYACKCVSNTCREGLTIQDEVVSAHCASDNDCRLVDRSLRYDSCFPGACAQVDYSLETYIAVNSESFEEFTKKKQPTNCGPAPLCPIQVINDKYMAKCLSNVCEKVTKAGAIDVTDAKTQAECEDLGADWVYIGKTQKCEFPASDAGRSCIKSTDCQRVCEIANLNDTTGTCSAHSGSGCYRYLDEQGEARMVCVD